MLKLGIQKKVYLMIDRAIMKITNASSRVRDS